MKVAIKELKELRLPVLFRHDVVGLNMPISAHNY